MKLASLTALLLAPAALAQDAVVPTDFPTIQSAVQGATDVDGDGTVHVFVQAGTYAETVQIQRTDLRLEGAGASSTTITGIDGIKTIRALGSHNLDLSGFTVLGSFARDGIEVTGTDVANVHDNTVIGTNDGIRINRSNDVRVENNRCLDNGSAGIKLKGGLNNIIVGNTCDGNRSSGVDLDRTFDATVLNNVSMNNNSNGVRVRRSARITVDGNTCTGNFGNGIRLRDMNNMDVTGNDCTGNVSSGLRMRDVSNSNIFANTFASNGEWGVRRRDSFGNDWDESQAGNQSAPGTNDVTGNMLGSIRND